MCTEKENTKIYQLFNEIEMWKGKAINAEHKADEFCFFHIVLRM